MNVHQECVHTRFLKDVGMQQFPDEDTPERGKKYLIYLLKKINEYEGLHRPVILFHWDMNDIRPCQMFSIATENRKDSVKSRVVVTHLGDDSIGGEWGCSKDGKLGCSHVEKAKKYLRELGGESLQDVNDEEHPVPGGE